jgi:hypothetical protein
MLAEPEPRNALSKGTSLIVAWPVSPRPHLALDGARQRWEVIGSAV